MQALKLSQPCHLPVHVHSRAQKFCVCWQSKLLLTARQEQRESATAADISVEEINRQKQLILAREGLLQWVTLASQVRFSQK